MTKPAFECDGVELYLGDCEQIMLNYGHHEIDAIVTDPPYGIDYGSQLKGKGDGYGNADKNGWKDYGAPDWDVAPPTQSYFDLMRYISKHQIIWGGNYFTNYLRPTQQWLVWDKMQRDFSLADCEFAWSSQDKASRIFSYSRGKALQDGKVHPTQKPVQLMKWCLGHLPMKTKVVMDPFMGSGTTGVACVQEGIHFIGVEKQPEYIEKAIKRIEAAAKEPDLFVAPQAAKQEDLL